jgi:ATP/maltotriose-dependent transcriptional regulator MalT
LTKFVRPHTRPEHVHRERCLQLLASEGRRHVLLTAPGGSGKSILAAQMLSVTPDPGAWISLETDDDEASRFWTVVVVALRTALPDFGDYLLSNLIGGADVERVLIQLARELAEHHRAVSLVIDDVHRISDPVIVGQIGWFLDRVDPSHCRLILCSRTRPPIPVARLVVAAKLSQLEPADLGFDDREARELLIDRLGVALGGEDIAALTAGTDGWPAGLYLASLSLRTGASAASVITALRTPGRQLQQYFAEEILDTLDSADAAFLEDISILDRFTAELCDAVRDQDDSQLILDRLADNMFLVDLDAIGHWQRLHHTLAGVLRHKAYAANRDLSAGRHVRAARWHEQHRDIPESIQHYLAAQQYAEAARLIGIAYPRFVVISSHGAVVHRWLSQLPADVITGSLRLTVASALVAGIRGEQADMQRWLTHLDTLPIPTNVQSYVDWVKAWFPFGRLEQALTRARQGLANCAADDPMLPLQASCVALLCSWVDGPTDEILQAADQILAIPSTVKLPPIRAMAWALSACVLASRKDPRALHALRQLSEIRAGGRIKPVPQAMHLWSTAARAYLLCGDVDTAAAISRAGYEIVADIAPERDAINLVIPALIELVHALRLQGHIDEARVHCAEARRRLTYLSEPGRLGTMLEEASEGL